MTAQVLMTCGFILIVCTPPFPMVIASFSFLGFGMAINLALGNVFAANLQNGTNMLGSMHGSYGVSFPLIHDTHYYHIRKLCAEPYLHS